MGQSIADKISDAELEVVRAVWETGEPATFSQIRETVMRDARWGSISTLNTLVSRLVKKGILRQEKRDVYYYTCTISREEYMRDKTDTFVRKVYGGSARGLVAALLQSETIRPEELAELQKYWEQEGRGDA